MAETGFDGAYVGAVTLAGGAAGAKAGLAVAPFLGPWTVPAGAAGGALLFGGAATITSPSIKNAFKDGYHKLFG